MFAMFTQLKISDNILHADDSYPWLLIVTTWADYKKKNICAPTPERLNQTLCWEPDAGIF